jgi:hypothetical protein
VAAKKKTAKAKKARQVPRKGTLPEDMPEYAVDKDTLMQFFRPPIGKSKFYELQQDGFIVPVEGVKGRYRLNLSLARLGLVPVKKLPSGPDERQEEERMVRLALWLAAPDAIESPAWLLDEDPPSEMQGSAAMRAAWYYRDLEKMGRAEERRSYVEGVLDALHMRTREG